MRRLVIALSLLVYAASVAPSQAQWWGGGWGRPCFGGCGPWMGRPGGWAGPGRLFVVPGGRPFQGGPGAFAPARLRIAWGWGWRPMWWRRELRRRRFEAWRRWAEAGREAAQLDAPRHLRFDGWKGRRVAPEQAAARVQAVSRVPAVVEPPRPEAAVAMIAPGGSRPRLAGVRSAPLRHILAAVATTRPLHLPPARPATPLMAPAVARVPEPPARPREAEPNRAAATATRRAVKPAALRSEPMEAPASAAPIPAPEEHPAAVAPATPSGASGPQDVPVAPLD